MGLKIREPHTHSSVGVRGGYLLSFCGLREYKIQFSESLGFRGTLMSLFWSLEVKPEQFVPLCRVENGHVSR